MSLTSHWKLDDNAASTTVVATVGSNATLAGGDNTSALTVAGPGGSITAGLDLDGSADSITISGWPIAAGSAGSVSVWFKCDGTPSAGRLFGNSGASQNQVLGVNTDTQIYIRIAGAASTFTWTIPSLGTSNWHHLLFTKTSGDSYRVFLDGTESSTGSQSSGASWSTGADSIGRSSGAFFNGRVAWCKFFNSDESANVATLYAEGVTSGGSGPNKLYGKFGGKLFRKVA